MNNTTTAVMPFDLKPGDLIVGIDTTGTPGAELARARLPCIVILPTARLVNHEPANGRYVWTLALWAHNQRGGTLESFPTWSTRAVTIQRLVLQ